MSKATVTNPKRACIFTVTCVGWSERTPKGRTMARRYSLSYKWERVDGDSGIPIGEFSPQSTLEESANWSTCLKTLKGAMGPANQQFGTSQMTWEPVFLVWSDEFGARRLKREVNTYLNKWHSYRHTRKALDALESSWLMTKMV